MLNTSLTPALLDFCGYDVQSLEIVDLGEEEEKSEQKLKGELEVKITHHLDIFKIEKRVVFIDHWSPLSDHYQSVIKKLKTPPPELA
ncbi:MAG: hypothetical protein ACWA5P_10290 [bacterium]